MLCLNKGPEKGPDFIAVNQKGHLLLGEIKRGPMSAVAWHQAKEYARRFGELRKDQLGASLNKAGLSRPLKEAIRGFLGGTAKRALLNPSRRKLQLVLVAESFSDQMLRIASLDNLGSTLKKLRTEKGIGLRQLSRQANISPASLLAIEKGTSSPTLATLGKILNELGIDGREFFNRAFAAVDLKQYVSPQPQLSRLLKKLKTVYNRDFSSGFYLGKPVNEWVDAYGSKATKKKIYLGYIKNFYNEVSVAEVILETDNIKLNDRIMIQGPTTGVFEQNASSMETNHKKVTSAKKGKRVGIKIIRKARINDKVYLIR